MINSASQSVIQILGPSVSQSVSQLVSKAVSHSAN